MEETRAGIEAVANRLQSDRLLKIVIGSGDNSFYVQQVLLESLSEYFVKAIKHEQLGIRSESGVLRFPEGDLEAWKVLLFWTIRRKFPLHAILEDCELLVKCWILGDTYNISRFQDEAMLALLKYTNHLWIHNVAVTAAFVGTPPGSKLRRLVAEEIAQMLNTSVWTYSDVDDSLNGTNFAADLFKAMDLYSKTIDERCMMECRFGYNSVFAGSSIPSSWRSYLVANDVAGFGEDVETFLARESAQGKAQQVLIDVDDL